MKKRNEAQGDAPAVQDDLAAQYAQLTGQAAALERAGLLGDAAQLWHTGAECAPTERGRFWCETRALLCQYRQRRMHAQSQRRRS